MLDDGDSGMARGKCLAQVLVRFWFDTAAKKYQVKPPAVEMVDSLMVGKGMGGVPGRVVVDESHNGLHNIRVAAYDKDLNFIHSAKILCGF